MFHYFYDICYDYHLQLDYLFVFSKFSLSFLATDGPIFGIRESFNSGIFAIFATSVMPASCKLRALILPIPSSLTSGKSSSFIPYFIRSLRLYIDPSKSSRRSNLATSYKE